MSGPVVFKFGGSSVADAPRLRQVAGLIAREPSPIVVVVSALGGVTDTLVELEAALLAGDSVAARSHIDTLRRRHLDVLDELGGGPTAPLDDVWQALEEMIDAPGAHSERADRVRAAGEDLSSLLLTVALRAQGVPARRVDARDVVRTDARFTRARPDEATLASRAWAELMPVVRGGEVAVVQGFVGATDDGRTTTLGRGGSDFTATLLAAALEAPELHIWTDVEGVLSGDPRTVAAPRLVDSIGYEEAVELAHFGAKVLHPAAAKHAASRGLVVRVRSTFSPDHPGTRILRERLGPAGVAAVAHSTGVALIRVRSHASAMPYGFLARVFDVLSRQRLPVDLVATSHTRTAFTLDAAEDLAATERELSAFADVTILRGLATVTLVGRGLMSEPGVNARVFEAVGTTPVHLVSQASDVTLSLVVEGEHAPGLVRRLHTHLIEDGALGDEPGPASPVHPAAGDEA